MGYSIDQLKKTGTLEGNDTIPVMQGGLTKQVAAGILDNAKIITAAGSQASGIIRREMTYILKNNSSAINFTLNNAVGKKVVNNDYSDDAATATGWIVKVMNVSTRSHVVIVGSNSWDIAKNENMYFFWTGSAWTLHNARMNNLIVDGELKLPNAAAVTSLQATSKLAGLDANGKVNYTTPDAIKDTLGLATTTSVNNALAKYNKQIILASGYNDTIENFIASLRQNGIIQIGQNTIKGESSYANRIVITNCGGITNTDATLNTIFEINYISANIYSVRILIGRSYGTTIKSGDIYVFYKESSTLTYWEKVTTETDLLNYIKVNKITTFIDTSFNGSEMSYTEDNGIIHIWGTLKNTSQKAAYSNICYVPRPKNNKVISSFLFNNSGDTQKLQIITDSDNKGRLQNQVIIPINSTIKFEVYYASYNDTPSAQTLSLDE